MGKTCFSCGTEVKTWTGGGQYFPGDKIKAGFLEMEIPDDVLQKMSEEEILCWNCGNKIYCKHAVEVYHHYESKLMPDEFEQMLKAGEDWVAIAKAELSVQKSSTSTSSSSGIALTSKPKPSESVSSPQPSQNKSKTTTVEDLERLMKTRHDATKAKWNKNGIIQYKDENIAILQRVWGQQVQFIVACSQVTNEGYRLMAIDEGKTGGQSSGGLTGGVNAYFYFQKMDYVR